jgi:hypothetical protein
MPLTYNSITATTLTAPTASVVFSNIPNTYTDLLIKMSTRSARGGVTNDNIRITLNLSNNYSQTNLTADYNTPSSTRSSGNALWTIVAGQTAGASSANIFSNNELYLANYATSIAKTGSFASTVTDSNPLYLRLGVNALLNTNTGAITSITLEPNATFNFATNSSFFLYGIKNS